MQKKEYEMPEEYQKSLAHLADFLEAREGYRKQISEAHARGVQVSAADKALVDATLRDFDKTIDELESALAKEYDRYQAEMAKEEKISESVNRAWEATKRLYIIIKHQQPELLESFTKNLDPLTPEDREQFFDEVAILESTNLQAILNGEA